MSANPSCKSTGLWPVLCVALLAAFFSLTVAAPVRADMIKELKAKAGDADAAFALGAEYGAKKGESNVVTALDWYAKAGEGFLKKNDIKSAGLALTRMKKLD